MILLSSFTVFWTICKKINDTFDISMTTGQAGQASSNESESVTYVDLIITVPLINKIINSVIDFFIFKRSVTNVSIDIHMTF